MPSWEGGLLPGAAFVESERVVDLEEARRGLAGTRVPRTLPRTQRGRRSSWPFFCFGVLKRAEVKGKCHLHV